MASAGQRGLYIACSRRSPTEKPKHRKNGAVGKDCAGAQADSAAILRKKRIERLTLFFGGKWG